MKSNGKTFGSSLDKDNKKHAKVQTNFFIVAILSDDQTKYKKFKYHQ